MMKTVLVITNKDDITVDFIIRELQKRSISYYRLNTEEIPDRVAVTFDISKQEYLIRDKQRNQILNLLEFDSVYYRRPALSSLNHIQGVEMYERNYLKSELSFVLEGIYQILRDKFWINNVYRIREAENKILQLQIANELGFRTPSSLVTNEFEYSTDFFEMNKRDCIVKPIKSGNLRDEKSPKAIFTTQVVEDQLVYRERIESFPVFFQEKIEKAYDIRVTVIGNDVFAAQIHSQTSSESAIDWRKGNSALEHNPHALPDSVVEMCIGLSKRFCLIYAAIDLILDKEGNYIFLEINPNGQWAWLEKRLSFPLSEKIVDMLANGGEKYEKDSE